MPLLELSLVKGNGETEDSVRTRLLSWAEREIPGINESTEDTIIWTPAPNYQVIGDIWTLRWKYKQYPNT